MTTGKICTGKIIYANFILQRMHTKRINAINAIHPIRTVHAILTMDAGAMRTKRDTHGTMISFLATLLTVSASEPLGLPLHMHI